MMNSTFYEFIKFNIDKKIQTKSEPGNTIGERYNLSTAETE